MAKLTKYEKETIILTNEGDNFWTVFTYNKGLQRRLQSFAEQHPENCRFKSQNNEDEMILGPMCVNDNSPAEFEKMIKHIRGIRGDFSKLQSELESFS